MSSGEALPQQGGQHEIASNTTTTATTTTTSASSATTDNSGSANVVVVRGSCHCSAVSWEYNSMPDGATACNCTVCRRYGALWAYSFENNGATVSGETRAYIRGKAVEFHFCTICGCVAFYRAIKLEEDGMRKLAVNLRMAVCYDDIKHIPIDHFDGYDTFDDLPRDGKCISDYWF